MIFSNNSNNNEKQKISKNNNNINNINNIVSSPLSGLERKVLLVGIYLYLNAIHLKILISL